LENKIITFIDIKQVSYSLIKTYNLSFGNLDIFSSIQVEIIILNGEKRFAEVVPLIGYSKESSVSICDYLETKKKKLIGMSLFEARSIVEKDIQESPFATSPILTAIDSFDFKVIKQDINNVNYVIPTSTSSRTDLIDTVLSCKKKNKTVKIKLSTDVETDISMLAMLEKETNAEGIELRLDANQAYSYGMTIQLFNHLNKSRIINIINYVEQPMCTNAWDEYALIIRDYPSIPVMLDESVITIDDLKKAFEIGARYIKVKLFKHGGIKELINIVKYANSLGLGVVIGNGVATIISNIVEIEIYRKYQSLFFGACEANGHLKVDPMKSLDQ